MFAAVSCVCLALTSATSDEALFTAKADRTALATFPVAGLKHPASGTVYPAGALEHGGMPLGGVGTGYLCLDPDGRLGKTSIFHRLPAPIALNKPVLWLWWEGKPIPLVVSPDGKGPIRAAHYFGHFPVADVRFDTTLPLSIELRAYSPFIVGDAVTSNTPAAVFEVHLANRSPDAREARVVFSPGGFPDGAVERFAIDGYSAVQVRHRPIESLPAEITHTYSLAAEGGEATSISSGMGPATVAASRNLAGGQRATFRFILAWHQPRLREGSGRIEKVKYAERFADAKAVAAEAIRSSNSWLRRVLAWQDVIYGSSLPDWLKETLVNAPYALTKNSVWLARTRPDDWWTAADGLFVVNESFSTCPLTETMPCRFFGHWPALFFFPELELSTLKAIRYFQLRGGEPPFALGMGFALRDPRYHCQHTCGAGEYAQMIYRYYLRTGDEAFLRDFWPSARDALRFMLTLDADGDGLVEDQSHAVGGEPFPANNPLDQWPWYGASSYTAGKGLAALVCGIRMAEMAGDTQQANAWRAVLEKGRKTYEQKLWTGSYYRTYNDTAGGRRNDACFSAQLSGVWCTRVLGLEDPLPVDRIQQALTSVMRLNQPASPFGMVDAVFADGKPCVEGGPGGDRVWSRDIFIQCNATAAMVYFYHGRAEEGRRAARAMLDTIFRGPRAMPWSQPCGINTKDGGTCHGHDYYDHMVVWTYPLAFARQDLRAACAPGGLIRAMLDAAAHTSPKR